MCLVQNREGERRDFDYLYVWFRGGGEGLNYIFIFIIFS
jgi:hypothetical protein